MKRLSFGLAFLISCLFQAERIRTGGKIELKLIRYNNPTHKTAKGQCCDHRCYDCDNYFIIRIKQKTTNTTKLLKEIWTEDYTRDKITFGRTFCEYDDWCDIAENNPLVLQFQGHKGWFELDLEVWDNDMGADKLNHDYNMFVASWKRNITFSDKPFTLTSGPANLHLKLSISCDSGYFKPSCIEYCSNRSDTGGHYYCDFETAKKVCYSGWYGKNCTQYKQPCTPKDNANGHYKCDNITGKKICLKGWTDESKNCTVVVAGSSAIHSSSSWDLRGPISTIIYSNYSKATLIHDAAISSESLSNTMSRSGINSQSKETSASVSRHLAISSTNYSTDKLQTQSKKDLSISVNKHTWKMLSSSKTTSSEISTKLQNFYLTATINNVPKESHTSNFVAIAPSKSKVLTLRSTSIITNVHSKFSQLHKLSTRKTFQLLPIQTTATSNFWGTTETEKAFQRTVSKSLKVSGISTPKRMKVLSQTIEINEKRDTIKTTLPSQRMTPNLSTWSQAVSVSSEIYSTFRKKSSLSTLESSIYPAASSKTLTFSTMLYESPKNQRRILSSSSTYSSLRETSVDQTVPLLASKSHSGTTRLTMSVQVISRTNLPALFSSVINESLVHHNPMPPIHITTEKSGSSSTKEARRRTPNMSHLVYIGILIPSMLLITLMFVGAWKYCSQGSLRKRSVTKSWYNFKRESTEVVPHFTGRENSAFDYELDAYNTPPLRAKTSINWQLWELDSKMSPNEGFMFQNPAYVPKRAQNLPDTNPRIIRNPLHVQVSGIKSVSHEGPVGRSGRLHVTNSGHACPLPAVEDRL